MSLLVGVLSLDSNSRCRPSEKILFLICCSVAACPSQGSLGGCATIGSSCPLRRFRVPLEDWWSICVLQTLLGAFPLNEPTIFASFCRIIVFQGCLDVYTYGRVPSPRVAYSYVVTPSEPCNAVAIAWSLFPAWMKAGVWAHAYILLSVHTHERTLRVLKRAASPRWGAPLSCIYICS